MIKHVKDFSHQLVRFVDDIIYKNTAHILNRYNIINLIMKLLF